MADSGSSPAQPATGRLAGKRILLIEDDADLAQLIETALRNAGCEVAVCTDGRQALQLVGVFGPEVVVLDVMLPGIDGYTLRHQLAQDKATSTLPVVVLTALESSRVLFQDASSVSAFLTKPFEPAALLGAIEQALSARKGSEGVRE